MFPRRPNRAGRVTHRSDSADSRLTVLRVVFLLALLAVAGRLFVLQVVDHSFYSALASNQHGVLDGLFPDRGEVYLSDPKSPDGRFPAIVNRNVYLVFADTRQHIDAEDAAKKLAEAIGPDADAAALADKLRKPLDPYVPLAPKLDDATAGRIRALGIKGIGLAVQRVRYYPEGSTLSHVTGFLGSDAKGNLVGRYGLEGHLNAALAGTPGHMGSDDAGLTGLLGSAGGGFTPAKDGDEITLTIDRTIQFVACGKLKAAVEQHGAESGALIIADPATGAILAMCGVPDFDPNAYSQVKDIADFNNPAIFEAYEPGSIFKPFTLVAGIDAGKITPHTTYVDSGSVTLGDYVIRNSDHKAHGTQTMTQVLDESLNTGTIFAVRQLGAAPFRQYMDDFGFGKTTGVELDTEAPGDISSLAKHGDIWSATASFGQGITATPIQLIAAFGALANGGKLMKPYVIAETKHDDGTVDKTAPTAVRQVVTRRAAGLIDAMLVDVVENGHGKRAGVPGYWVAGKTGTAQISRGAGLGYEANAAIGSFIGYAPVDNPAFVMLVKLNRPKDVQWAESSAAPLFGDIAKFLLQYMEIPPERH